jgi:putative acetyltransferase
MDIRRAEPVERDVLVEIWLRSVRATHTFLSEDDIASLLPGARAYLTSDEPELWVACDDAGAILGFMGMAGSEVATLFLAPESRGHGVGRQLVRHARALRGELTVTVNEQNDAARGFYEAMGFVVEGRSAVDDAGRPFPVLYLRLRTPYAIRPARPDEVARLGRIEDEAGARFSGLGLVDEARDASFPPDALARLIGLGQVWVACEDDVAVGMAIASVRDGVAYVEEMDVLPAHGRQGLGGRLLERVCAWAGAQGLAAVTLSTFRDVPWNGPFYRRHGFRDLPPAEWTPWMRAIRAEEARRGLQVDARVFMRREAPRPGRPVAGRAT